MSMNQKGTFRELTDLEIDCVCGGILSAQAIPEQKQTDTNIELLFGTNIQLTKQAQALLYFF